MIRKGAGWEAGIGVPQVISEFSEVIHSALFATACSTSAVSVMGSSEESEYVGITNR